MIDTGHYRHRGAMRAMQDAATRNGFELGEVSIEMDGNIVKLTSRCPDGVTFGIGYMLPVEAEVA